MKKTASFSDQLRAARERAGLTQQQAADRLTAAGLKASRRTLEKWELGTITPEPFKQEAILKLL